MRWSVPMLAVALAACDEPADTDVTDTDATAEGVDTVGGLYHLVLVAEPDPPTTGQATLTMTITSGDEPAVGAEVAVEPWMPDMGHGVQTPPTVTEQGDGVYVATWSYSMPGYWELTITVEDDAGEDSVVVGYDVE